MLEVPFLILQLKQVMAMYRFTLSGTNSQILGPSYQKDSSPNEIVLDFSERRFSSCKIHLAPGSCWHYSRAFQSLVLIVRQAEIRW